jgi:hypothetical protein
MKRKEGAFAVAQAAVFAVVIVLVSLPVQSANQQQVSTSQNSETAQGSDLGSDGLQLTTSLNASQLSPGQVLQVNVSVFNTLSTANSLPVSERWPFQGIPLALWPDCDLMLLGPSVPGFNVSAPAEAVVIKGDYTISNITSAADIHFPVVPCAEAIEVDQVIFGPRSGQANLTGDYIGRNETLGPYQVASTFTMNGYWDLLNNAERAQFFSTFSDNGQQQAALSPVTTPFTPGVYTVGIEDIWGQAVILHFSVVA